MIKTFTKFQVAALKRTMKNIAPLTRKRNSLRAKIDELTIAIAEVENQITAYKQSLDPITGGIDPEIIIANNGRIEFEDCSDELCGHDNIEPEVSVGCEPKSL